MAAFLLGLTLRTANDPLSPVMVASRNIDEDTYLQLEDFSIEYHRVSTLPFGVLTAADQIGKQYTVRKIRHGQYIFPEDLSSFRGHVYIPEGRKVVALRIEISKHSLVLHLFSQGDRISVRYVTQNDDGTREIENIADSAILFSADESPEDDYAIVGLMVTEDQGERIYDAQKRKLG